MVPLPHFVGEDAIRSRSRGRTPPASDVKQRILFASPLFDGGDRRAFNPERATSSCCGATLCGSLPANKIREAERRQTRSPRPVRKRRTGRATEKAACAALPLRARSPAGVPPRHLRQRPNATAQLQFTRFLGRYEVGMGVTHPRPSQCSGRYEPAGRSSCRPGVLARSRPGAGVTAPPAGTALAPANRRHPTGVPSGRDWPYVTERGTNVKTSLIR